MREIKFKCWDSKDKKMFIPNGLTNPLNLINQERYIHLQNTGLLDSKGKEIYEGDIIEYEWSPCGMQRDEVVFKERCWAVKGGNNYMPNEEYREIIGNVYENPNLIK